MAGLDFEVARLSDTFPRMFRLPSDISNALALRYLAFLQAALVSELPQKLF